MSDRRPETQDVGAVLVHADDCPGAQLVERESAHKRLLICSGCSALVSLPRVARWREDG